MFKSKKYIISQLIIIIPIIILPCFSIPQENLDVALDNLIKQINQFMEEKDKIKIAIIPFRDIQKQATTALGTYLAEELTTNLFLTGKFKIVERNLLEQLIDELKLSKTGIIDPNSAKELGKMAGVDAIVSGTVTDLGSYIAVNCRLIETETGEVFAAAKAKIKIDENLANIIEGDSKSPKIRSKSEPEAKVKVKENQKGRIINIKNKVSYFKRTSYGQEVGKWLKVELISVKILNDGRIECDFLYTALEDKLDLYLINPDENSYISDRFGNRYSYISSTNIGSVPSVIYMDKKVALKLQKRVPVKATITFAEVNENIDEINIINVYKVHHHYYAFPEFNSIFSNIKLKN